MPEIPLVCHYIHSITDILWVLNSVALILSNQWLAVYSCLDLIPKENTPPPKIHILLFIFTSFCLVSLHCPCYVAQPHTHTVPWVRGCQEKRHLNKWVKYGFSFLPLNLKCTFTTSPSLHHQPPLTVPSCQLSLQGTVFFQSYTKWNLKEIKMPK